MKGIKAQINYLAEGFRISSQCWSCLGCEVILALVPYVNARIFKETVNGIINDSGLTILLLLLAGYGIVQIIAAKCGRISTVSHLSLRQECDLAQKKKIQNCIKKIDITLFEDEKWKIEKLNRVNSLTGSLYDEVTAQFRMLSVLLSGALFLSYLMTIDKSLFIWGVLAFLPPVIKSMFYSRTHLKQSRIVNKCQQRYGRVYNMFFEKAFSQEIRIFDAFEYLKKKWCSALESVYENKKKMVATDYIVDFFCSFLAAIIYIIILLKIGMVHSDVGLIVAVIPYALSVAGTVNSFDMTVKSIYYSILELDETDRFLQACEEQGKEGLHHVNRAEIVLENIGFEYPNGKKVIDNISLQINPGEMVALIGENGSGKSTLLKIIAGIYRRYEGEVRIGGKKVQEIDSKVIAMMFQFPVCYPFGMEENIELGKSGGDAAGYLEEMKIRKREGILTDGFTNSIDLSGGEWQKIAMARLFENRKEAEIFLFDEPTSALDPISELEIFEHFQMMTRGKTCIYATHRLGIARSAKKIFVLSHGNIEEAGTHDELIQKNGKYAKMYRSQSSWYVNRGENENIV